METNRIDDSSRIAERDNDPAGAAATIDSVNLSERLRQLGLVAAATTLTQQVALAKKLEVAYEHYRFVTKEKIDQFNQKLYKTTMKPGGQFGQGSYQQLTFTSLALYRAAPPSEVLDALEAAQALQVFDVFEVATITEQHIPKPDPILFGRIDGCTDQFYISQWDADVRIEDILQADEGYVK